MLKSPPILTTLTPEELMLLYISATTQVVSAALVVKCEELGRSHKVQRPVYFVSEVHCDSKTQYLQMQKLLYAILMTKRKLQHYFDVHPITVCLSTRSRRSSITLRLKGESLSGHSSCSDKIYHMHHAAPSSLKYSQTSLRSGRRSRLPGADRARDMDHVLRRIDHEGRSRCRPCLHLAYGRAYGVLGPTTLSGIQ
jgi:hypothetical protein